MAVGIETSGYGPPRRRVRANFYLSGHSYSFSMTDPIVEEAYFRRADGEYPSENALLCVSLGEEFHGHAYKLAAAVITKEDAER